MKVEVESLDRVRKSIEVILDDERINALREEIYEDLKKSAKIKGFRPGKVPRSVIQAFYKDFVDDELKRKMIEETMGNALSETHVEPVSEPHIQFLDEDTRHGYKMECEVVPEFDLPTYQGIGAEVEKITVTDDEVATRLESLRQMHAELVDREADRAAQKGDMVIVKYEGFRDGQPVKHVKSDAYPIDLGGSNLMPEFENGLIGMKVGEEKEIEINFAADYPDKDIASKRILFKLFLKEIKEKRLPELNDEFAKDVGFEHIEQLASEARRELEKEREAHRRNAITEQIAAFLLENTDIPVPSRLLHKKVEMMVQDARTRMKTGTLNKEEDSSFNATLQKEYEPEAEKRIRLGMILTKIADFEEIKVDDSEVDERLKRIAEESKRSYDYIKDFYEKYDLTGNLKNGMLEEKTLNFLVEKAAVKEKE
jgi:trigger factor